MIDMVWYVYGTVTVISSVYVLCMYMYVWYVWYVCCICCRCIVDTEGAEMMKGSVDDETVEVSQETDAADTEMLSCGLYLR